VLVSLPVGLLMCLILTVVALLVWRVPVHPTDAERSDHLDDIPDRPDEGEVSGSGLH
jgi:hypothetical protein